MGRGLTATQDERVDLILVSAAGRLSEVEKTAGHLPSWAVSFPIRAAHHERPALPLELTVPKKKHGRDPGRQPQRRRPASRPRSADRGPEDQELLQTLRQALRSGEPLDFLAVMSGFLEVMTPGAATPWPPMSSGSVLVT
jgi:hypothetical protein